MKSRAVVMPAPGTFLVIRTNDTIELINEKPTFDRLHELVKCATFDTVTLPDGYVMCVDDTGYLNDKPRNDIATEIYHQRCIPGTTHPICGDVAIVYDDDFANDGPTFHQAD